MEPSPKNIRVKTVGLFIHNGRILAHNALDRVDNQHFMLLMGGGVEFGELSDGALKRELFEEIGAEVTHLRLLTVIENIFTFEAEKGHEIVFVYLGEFADLSIYERESIPFVEPGRTEIAGWVPIASVLKGDVRLYPEMDYKSIFTGLEAV